MGVVHIVCPGCKDPKGTSDEFFSWALDKISPGQKTPENFECAKCQCNYHVARCFNCNLIETHAGKDLCIGRAPKCTRCGVR